MTWDELWCYLWKHTPMGISGLILMHATCARCGAKLIFSEYTGKWRKEGK